MKKTLLLLTTTAILCGCGSNSISKKFKDAIDLGSLAESYDIAREDEEAHKDVTNYYKFHLAEKLIYDKEEYRCLSVVAYDCYETYNYYSYIYEFHIYDSEFKELPTSTAKELIPDAPEEGDAGKGSHSVTQDLEIGDYYFSITPAEEPQDSTINFWVSFYLGD